MKKSTTILILSALALLIGAFACKLGSKDDAPATTFHADPILTFGHGTFLGANAEPFVPNEAFVLGAQEFYASTLREAIRRDPNAKPEVLADLDTYDELIHEIVDDRVLANAVYLDWLLERQTTIDARIEIANHALRWHYLLKIKKDDAVLPKGDRGWWKGLKEATARELEGYGVQTFSVTNSGGPAYRRDCEAAGVPVPDQVLSDDWTNRGVFDNEFLSTGSEAELWMWTSENPPGVCLALPRYNSADEATLLGVICLGTQSSKICFFDNPNGTFFPRNQPIPIDQFVGGADLVPNGQGTCSDCHAGENPYVVHPDKPAFQGLTSELMPAKWPEPLVVAQWPHNPGPTGILAAIPSPQQCDSCHVQNYAGRFPQVSQALSGYCGVVLGSATGGSTRTMPMGGGSISPYDDHVATLTQSCQNASPTPKVETVDLRDDRSFLSPPTVLDPIYGCATLVAVRGAVLDAEVQLFVDSAQVGSFVPARDPQKIEFSVPALSAGQRVKALQIADGATSDFSPEVVVRDHREDYPDGLPAPTIDPTLIYECAEVIAVRHVPTAVVTVFCDGADPVTVGSSTGWTTIHPGKRPFVVGETFTAEISICSDRSGLSTGVDAVSAPASLPPAHFDPSVLYTGQELVTVVDLTHGSLTSLEVLGVGPAGKFTTPVSWRPDFDVASQLGRSLTSSDVLTATQKLCALGSTSPPTQVRRCPELTAPRIEPPRAGDTFVIVADAVPGARVRVYDAANNEIGDGSGVVVLLSRPLQAGEILTVVQELEECLGRQGYVVTVLGKG